MLIPCPHCGARDECEFVYGGPRRPLPAMTDQSGTSDWYEALYTVPNPRGPLVELWYHASGCETWFEVMRDTCTHDVTDHNSSSGQEGET